MFNSSGGRVGRLLRAAKPVFPDFHLLKKPGRPGMMRSSFFPLPSLLLLTAALGALFLFASPVGARTLDPPPSIRVTPGNQKLTLTWELKLGQQPISSVAVRWRVKDTDPDTDGNQPGGWIPPAPGYQAALSKDFNARSVPIPPNLRFCNLGLDDCGPLTNGTTYEVGAYFHGSSGNTGWLSAGEGTPRLDAPSRLEVTPGLGKLDLSWVAPSGNVTGYDVHYTRSTSADNNAALGTNVAEAWVDASHSGVGAEHTITGLTGLSEDEAYHRVRVRAKEAAANGAWAQGAGTVVVRLATPLNVTLAPGDGQVTVSWDAVEGANQYVIRHVIDGTPLTPEGLHAEVETTTGNVTTYAVTGLANDTKHFFRILARDNTGAYLDSIFSEYQLATPRRIGGL